MDSALDALPDDLREVVRLRLFEELTLEEIAARLNLGVSGVRHRFRRGGTLYQQALVEALGGSRRAGDA
jgi:RNA polymerase sigma factor (sigma-70 family)